MAGGGFDAAASGAAAPYLATIIKEMTGDNDTARLMSHAVLGAVVADLQGNSAAAGAAGAVTGETVAMIAQQVYGKTPGELSEQEKQVISNLSMLAGGLAGGLAGDSSTGIAAGAGAGKNAADNNALQAPLAMQRCMATPACMAALGKTGEVSAAALTSALVASGVMEELPVSTQLILRLNLISPAVLVQLLSVTNDEALKNLTNTGGNQIADPLPALPGFSFPDDPAGNQLPGYGEGTDLSAVNGQLPGYSTPEMPDTSILPGGSDVDLGFNPNIQANTSEGKYTPNAGSVGNMGELLNTPGFGTKINSGSQKTKQIYQGQSIYKANESIGNIIKKGDQFYLDEQHKNHLEVFDSKGRFKAVLNLDGSLNSIKTEAAKGRRL